MTPDGKRVVIAGSTCSMVDAETLGNPRTMTRFIDSGSPSATDDGSVLAFNCLVPSGTGEKWAAMLVDGATGAYLKTIIAGGTPSISSDGSRLVFKGATYKTYDVATGQLLSNIDQLNSWGVAPSADLKTLVGFAFARNEIHVFRTSEGVRTQVIIDDRFLGSTAGCLSDDGSKLYLVQQGRIAVFKTSDWSMVQEIPV